MKHDYRLSIIMILVVVFSVSSSFGQQPKQNYGKATDEIFPYQRYQKAYKYFFQESLNFYGAGREKVAPKDLNEIRIGFLGPLEGSVIVSLGKQMLQGATLAIEEANKNGGYSGKPFRLMIHNDVGLWGAAANEVVKMDDEKVWAFIGSIDDIVSHVALRATLKLEIPMVNTGDPDPTFTETNIPWAIRVITDDRQSAYALVNQIYKKDGHQRVAVIRTGSRYGRVGIKIYSETSVRVGHPMIIEERFAEGEKDFKTQLERIMVTSPDAILIWGNATESALLIKQIRALGFKKSIYGSDRVVSQDFLNIAGQAAEGIVSTCQYNPDSDNPKLKEFRANYRKRFGVEPDVFAAHAYDGMNLIIASIHKVGLNRVLIRDVLTDRKTFQNYKGITGTKTFDQSWNNIADIWIAKVNQGKFSFRPAVPMDNKQRISSKSADY
jgi:ABC-type branched-subunit amino acid transport system substrate-binding protein